MLVDKNEFYINVGSTIEVTDTVGSGDSFLAALLFKLLKSNVHYHEALDFACAIGTIVATKTGANPLILDSEINNMIERF